MTKKQRIAAWLLSFALCFGLVLPMSTSAAELYFTSLNDTLLPLTNETMPVWSGGILYVPYTTFDPSTTGINMGLGVSYSRNKQTVSVFSTFDKIITFNLADKSCKDEITGEPVRARAFLRNGTPYLPINTICSHFGLTSSLNTISQGYMVRIKNDAVVLSDAKFIDAAGDLINRRLREYNQSLTPSATTPSNPSTPSVTPEPDDTSPSDVRTYLAILCQDGSYLPAILDALQTNRTYAVFYFPPQLLAEDPALLQEILGSGHSIGLLGEGDTLVQVQENLALGNQLLEQLTHTRTTLVYTPETHRAALSAKGWICWDETLLLRPDDSVGAISFGASTLRQLGTRTRATYLTIGESAGAQRVLATLIRQLNSNHYILSIPMETKL